MPDGIITLTTGSVGVGKTYSRCAEFLLNEFLPFYDGVHYSNFPIKVNKMAVMCARLHPRLKLNPRDLKKRIKLIPKHVLEDWRTGKSEPWDFFKDVNLNNTHIAIDEVHNFYEGEKRSDPRIKGWITFLGEIRHRGGSIELLTQQVKNMPPAIRDSANQSIELKTCETDFDSIFKILNKDWYELKACLTREYNPKICQITKSDNSTGEPLKKYFYRLPALYKVYDSYSKPFAGGFKGNAQKQEFQRRSSLGLLFWFIRRNTLELTTRFTIVGFVFWLSICGGMITCLNWLMSGFTGAMGMATASASTEQSSEPQKEIIKSKQRQSVQAIKDDGSQPDYEIDSEIVIQLQNEKFVLEQQRAALQAKLTLEKKQVARLKAELQYNSTVVMFTPDSIVLQIGYEYKIGDLIDYGIHKNKQLKRIDYKRRKAVLSDDSVLRLGVQRKVQ